MATMRTPVIGLAALASVLLLGKKARAMFRPSPEKQRERDITASVSEAFTIARPTGARDAWFV
jgi:hypothetical protein